jgi:hypothetical protein
MTSALCPTAEELASMTPQQIAECKRAMAENVFGANCPRDSQGRYIEQGIGSAAQQSQQHLQALAREKAQQDQMKAMAKIAGTASD